jgi:hypothetical protein
MITNDSLPFGGVNLRGFPALERHLSSASIGVLSGNSPLAEDIGLFMVQVVIILSICRALGILGTYLKQPKVIFEIIGEPREIPVNAQSMDIISFFLPSHF